MTLARDGGPPVRTAPFPTYADASGRVFGPEEVQALTEVIARGTLWRVDGSEVPALEREFAEYIGRPYAVASTSGTAALHLATAALNPEPGDEIIVPPITDFGTVIAVLAVGAVPVFADVDPGTGCLTPETVEAAFSERTRAVIVVHLFGGPAPVDEIVRRCHPRGVRVIEDCAQAYLTVPPGGPGYAGTRGDIGCFSLQQSKHITAGDGGLTVTADAALAERMRLFADKAWPRDTDVRTHLFLGFNYRMTELVGAVARVQLTRLRGVVAARRRVAARLVAGLSGRPGLTVPDPEMAGRHSFWLFPLLIDPAVVGVDNRVYGQALAAEGIPVTAGYLERPLHLVPALTERRTFGTSAFPLTCPPARRDMRYQAGDCPVAERLIGSTLLVLPCNERFTEADADDIVAGVTKVHGHFLAAGGRP